MLDKFDQILKNCYEKSSFLQLGALKAPQGPEPQAGPSAKALHPSPFGGLKGLKSATAAEPQKLQPLFLLGSGSLKELFGGSIPQEEPNYASPAVDIFAGEVAGCLKK